MLNSPQLKRPIIGCATYRKNISQARPIDIYGLMPSYTEAITKAGGIPLLIPLGLSEDELEIILNQVDGLLLPGGGDIAPGYYKGRNDIPMWSIDKERDRTELFLSRLAVNQEVPFLAICRGLQVLNVALGGTLLEDIKSLVPDALNHDLPEHLPRSFLAHTVELFPDSTLFRHMQMRKSRVNSIHHQAIRDLAPELTVTAKSSDGIIEAVEIDGSAFAVGVQWHPENLVDNDPAMLALFAGLTEAAAYEGQARKAGLSAIA